MGVATMYKPSVRFLFLALLLFIIYSCTPRIIANEDILTKERNKGEIKKDKEELTKIDQNKVSEDQTSFESTYLETNNNKKIISEIEIILPSDSNLEITQNFINSLELSIYDKRIKNLSLNINIYSQKKPFHGVCSLN